MITVNLARAPNTIGIVCRPMARSPSTSLKSCEWIVVKKIPVLAAIDHSATPSFEGLPREEDGKGVRIHSGKERPAEAYAAVRYRGYWFWIEQGDWRTKRALTAIMFFFTIAEAGGSEQLPLITIPAQ